MVFNELSVDELKNAEALLMKLFFPAERGKPGVGARLY